MTMTARFIAASSAQDITTKTNAHKLARCPKDARFGALLIDGARVVMLPAAKHYGERLEVALL